MWAAASAGSASNNVAGAAIADATQRRRALAFSFSWSAIQFQVDDGQANSGYVAVRRFSPGSQPSASTLWMPIASRQRSPRGFRPPAAAGYPTAANRLATSGQ